jgi:predicted nucleic-acid-binding Zn-ribbon protein
MPGYFSKPEDEVLTDQAIQNAFDWIQLKHVHDTLRCPVCSSNVWGFAGRVGITKESEGFSPRKQRKLVQIICKNCEYVMLFSERILRGPLDAD